MVVNIIARRWPRASASSRSSTTPQITDAPARGRSTACAATSASRTSPSATARSAGAARHRLRRAGRARRWRCSAPTGSGKTTIINLIPRFYDVTAGRVLIDGHDVRDVDAGRRCAATSASSCRRRFLFSATIRENIAFGRPGGDRRRGRAPPREAARAHDFITRPARRLRHLRRRARRHPLRRPEAAHRHRARAAARPAHPDPRRLHLQRRHRDRVPDPAGADRADAGPHDVRHRPALADPEAAPTRSSSSTPAGSSSAAPTPS